MNIRIVTYFIFITMVGCSGSRSPIQKQVPNASVNTDSLLSYQAVITPDFLHSQLSIFAADSMEGRETGMPGQRKAARFLATQYKKLELQPAGDDNSYFQKFELTARQTDSVVFITSQSHTDRPPKLMDKSKNSIITSGNYIRQFGGNDVVQGKIVFAGYGIQNEALGIDQLKGVNLKNKWVMIFRDDIPRVIDGDTLYTDRRQFLNSRIRNILQKGVAGILTIPGMSGQAFDSMIKAQRQRFGKPTGMQLKYRARQQRRLPWSYDLISPRQAAKILNQPNGIIGLKALKNKTTQHLKTFKARKTDYELKQIPYEHKVLLETENVVAFIKGVDPELNDQVVILSAHYDHLGVGQPDSTGDRIYNGANDDGSGTIGVLSAARAFAKAKKNGIQPRRSILFLSVAGEEKGLLGSRYYSDHPIYPIKQTVADINTDMIGRIDPKHQKTKENNYIYVIGASIISSDIDSLMKAGNARAGKLTLDMRYNDLTDPNQFYRRSDHWNFGRLGIPFIFFFNGVHKDYHRPSDEVDKINFDLMTKTARSMYATTVMVANADSMPKVDNQKFIRITKGSKQ